MGTASRTITDSQTYSRKLFTILAVVGLLGAQLVGLGISPAHAAGVQGYITFSDGEGTTHKVDISDPSEASADITIEGYEWLGDGRANGPEFHISCSATLLDTEAKVVGPPFAANYDSTEFAGWPQGTNVVEIVDFDIFRQPGEGQPQECDPGSFDPQPAATVTLSEPCPTGQESTGVRYTIANGGDGNVDWTLTGTAGGDTIDESGTVNEDAADHTGFIALDEADTYNLTLTAEDDADNQLDTTTLQGTVDCEDDPESLLVNVDKTNDASENGVFSDSETAGAEGDAVEFQVVVTNSSDSTVSGTITELSDSWDDEELDLLTEADLDCGDDDIGDALAPGESITCTFTVDDYAPAAGGSLDNTIDVTLENTQNELDDSDSDDSTVDVDPIIPGDPEPDISIVKTATDGVEFDEDGDPFLAFEGDETFDVTYSYEITNTGEDDLEDLSLVDDQLGDLSGAFQDAVGEGPFETGESVTVTAVHEAVGADTFTDGLLVNIATVEGTGVESDETVDDTDDESIYDIEVLPLGPPSISIVKTATEGVTEDEEGNWTIDISNGNPTTVGYEYLITNTGDEDLTDLGLVDDKIGDLSEAFQEAVGDDTFEAGDSVTVTADYELTDDDLDAGVVTNIADVDGTGVDTGLPATDSDDETIFVTEVQAAVETADKNETEVLAETLPRTGSEALNLFLLGLLTVALGLMTLVTTYPGRRE